jgi:4-aminobutyrate aminotransferase/(S)-3-amino-2-methylpropionate transaminase
MLAIELVVPGTRTPDPATTKAAACHARGLVVLTAGAYGNVLRFRPPLVMPDNLLGEGSTSWTRRSPSAPRPSR